MSSTPFSYQQTPSPATPLNGHCSVIYNANGVDTLYAFQSNAFQSLPLKPGASWASLTPGVSVNGAKCVLGQWNNQDALIVVGGVPTDSAPKDFPGLQYYTFATNQWASIPSGTSVVQNRQMHGAAYLKSTNSLLVYSGFQDNSFTESSETFTIAAVPPYNSQAMPAGAPLAMNPIVLPWNASHAAMLGGSDSNRAVWVFNQASGWGKLGVSVPSIVTNMSAVTAATLNTANDGKVLELFDLTAIPNTVTSLTVEQSDSNPQARDIAIRDSLPAYNGTLASSVERVGYSLAQSPSSGLVVASGGTGDAASAVVMFNQTTNAWISPQAFFDASTGSNSNLQSPLGASSTSSASTSSSTDTASTSATSASASSSPASTSSAAISTSSTTATTAANLGPSTLASPTAAASSGGGLSQTNRTILGGVLGGLAGVGALLILLLLILRWRKQKKRARSPDYHEDDKGQMDFDDSGAVANYPRSASRGTKNSGKEEWKRMPTAQEKLGAPISKPNLISDSSNPNGIGMSSQTQPLISTTAPLPEAKSDDGWNQYFAKGGSSNALIPEEDRLRMDSVSHQTEYTSSNYDVESHTASIYQDQDTALLDPRAGGYPKSEQAWEPSKLHPANKRAPSSEYRPNSTISEEDEAPETFLNPASSTSGTQAWEALGPGDGQSTFDLRPSSSVYAESIQYPHPGDKVHIAGEDQSFNSSGATKGSSTTNNSWKNAGESRGMRTLATKDLTGGLSSKSQKDDMSWLNLGKQ